MNAHVNKLDPRIRPIAQELLGRFTYAELVQIHTRLRILAGIWSRQDRRFTTGDMELIMTAIMRDTRSR